MLDLVVWAAFFKYCFEVLRWTANGREKPPEISFTVNDNIAVYAVLLLILVELLLICVGVYFGAIATLGLGIVLMLAMPAMVTILALEEGMGRAINPLAWLMLMSRLGNQYFILAGFFCAAVIAQSVLGVGLRTALPGFVADFVTYCVVNYFMLTTFHLIGNVIYTQPRRARLHRPRRTQRRSAAHRSVAQGARRRPRTRRRPATPPAPPRCCATNCASHPDQLSLHDEYRHWLRQSEQKPELVAHAKKYIPVLIAKGHDRRAMEVVRECQAIDPAFALDNADDITRLAHAAAEAGQTQLAVGLVAGFHKRFRNHPDIARNYLLAAKLWAERMNKEMQARAMLQQIKLTLPNDPVIPQVDAYIAFLDKLAATPPKPPA